MLTEVAQQNSMWQPPQSIREGRQPSDAEIKLEMLKCRQSCAYFINYYCRIYDPDKRDWIPFTLWLAQYRVLMESFEYPRIVVLKARQEGMSWLLAIAKPLWLCLFRPIQQVLQFSRREEEAWALLQRTKDMHAHLPRWLQAKSIKIDAKGQWQLSNGSIIRAFPTTAGDSYQGTYAAVDEFDLLPNQQQLLDAVQPTIDAGGEMVLISRSDKDNPQSLFKKIYRAARAGENNWHSVFLSVFDHPKRTREWYEQKCRDSLANTGSLDSVHEHYPETDEQALMPRSLNKRISGEWLQQVYEARKPFDPKGTFAPAIPNLKIYAIPLTGRSYRFGADPAEGKEHGDNSSLDVLDQETGEQVAHLSAKIEPDVFGANIVAVSDYYNNATGLVELNNHGWMVIDQISEMDKRHILMRGKGTDRGWRTVSSAKSLMYDKAAEAIREGDCIIHNPDTVAELSLIESSTQSAPKGEKDDRATSLALALLARTRSVGGAIIPEAAGQGHNITTKAAQNPYLVHNVAPAQNNPYLQGATSGDLMRARRPKI